MSPSPLHAAGPLAGGGRPAAHARPLARGGHRRVLSRQPAAGRHAERHFLFKGTQLSSYFDVSIDGAAASPYHLTTRRQVIPVATGVISMTPYDGDVLGCASHPTVALHASIAQEVAARPN